MAKSTSKKQNLFIWLLDMKLSALLANFTQLPVDIFPSPESLCTYNRADEVSGGIHSH